MADELNYNLRPREMRGRDARERWTPAANRRSTVVRRETVARGPNYKLIRRGLNRDTSGPVLSRAIGAACAGLDRESLDAMRWLIYVLDAVACPLVPWDGGPRVLARLSRFHEDWIRSPRTWRQVVSDDSVQIVTSIASHLLGKYPVPRHLNDAWMQDTELHQA